MKLNKIALVLGLGVTMVCGSAMAAIQGQGTVTFKGSIIEAPCSITPDTVDQTVNLGQVSSKALMNGGTSSPQQFQIKLEGCDVSNLTNKTVTTAFNGVADGDNLKLQSGTASGAAIVIEDSLGQPVKINNALGTSPEGITDGTNTLHYSAYLKGGASSTIKTGDFTSVASFVLDYQ